MSNTLAPGDFRVGQISPTLEITGSVQSATLVFDERRGARLLVPYMPGVDQFAQTEAWFHAKDGAPKRLLFVDPRTEHLMKAARFSRFGGGGSPRDRGPSGSARGS